MAIPSCLECTEVQVVEVVDLSDRQNVFGLLETEDALRRRRR